jgi:hypothetical protein
MERSRSGQYLPMGAGKYEASRRVEDELETDGGGESHLLTAAACR